MNLKIKTNREKEKLKERGTKRFQERIAEEKEADLEIREFDLDKEKEQPFDYTTTIQELIR